MRVPTAGRRVRDTGELRLIEIMQAVVAGTEPGRLTLGIGDDAAVWRPTPGRHIVLSTDSMVEDQHFRIEWIDWRSLGHRALAVNLSDMAAMGARPRLALVSLGLTGGERDREVADLYRGMVALANEFRVGIAGGDVTRSESSVWISVTVVGEAIGARDSVMRRSEANPGDIIALTGPIGLAAGGLRVLETGLKTLDGGPAMQEAFLKPRPRVREGRILVRSGVRAAIDLSDGLLGDLPKICQASGVSADIDELKLPIPLSVRWAFDDWMDLALRGGDDYELLFTAHPKTFARVYRNFRRARLRPPIPIGRIVERVGEESQVRLRRLSGLTETLEPGAFTHFAPD
jgi:thiamine-monophosphate kinase